MPTSYHEMLQWTYGGGLEADASDDYYDDVQEGLERGRRRAFGQRKWGSGGYVAGGGARHAACVPASPSASSAASSSKAGKSVAVPRFSKMGFASSSGEGGASASASLCDEACGGSFATSPAASGGGGGGGAAARKRAEKLAIKEAQKEKRRSWATS